MRIPLRKVSVLVGFLLLSQSAPALAQSRPEIARTDVTVYSHGLSVAVDRGAVKPGSILYQTLQSFLDHLSAGTSVAEAAKQSGLQQGVVQRLYQMGQTAPVGYQQGGSALPVPPVPPPSPPVSPVAQLPFLVSPPANPIRAQPVSVSQSELQERIASLERKLVQLEGKVGVIDGQVAELDAQQELFVAKLDALGEQQHEFLAKLDRLLPPEPVASLEPSPAPVTAVTEVPPPVEPPVSAARTSPAEPIVIALPAPVPPSQHDIANALVMGLTTGNRNGQVKYHSGIYFQVQSAIRLVRRGEPLKEAIAESEVPMSVASQLLKWGGVDPGVVL